MTASKKVDTRILTMTGIMIAITAVMSFTPLGSIPTPWATITIAFLPTIVAAMSIGFWPAVAVGGSAGLFSLIRATYVVSILQPFLLNPLISVLPRIMVGVVVFLMFRALMGMKVSKFIAAPVSAAIGGITNTVMVLGGVWLLYGAAANEATLAADSPNFTTFWTFIVFVVTTNAIVEVIGYTILGGAIVLGLDRAKFLRKK